MLQTVAPQMPTRVVKRIVKSQGIRWLCSMDRTLLFEAGLAAGQAWFPSFSQTGCTGMRWGPVSQCVLAASFCMLASRLQAHRSRLRNGVGLYLYMCTLQLFSSIIHGRVVPFGNPSLAALKSGPVERLSSPFEGTLPLCGITVWFSSSAEEKALVRRHFYKWQRNGFGSSTCLQVSQMVVVNLNGWMLLTVNV